MPRVLLGDCKGHQLVQRQIAVTVDLHQLGRHRAQAKALPHHMRRDAEPGGDFFGAETAFFRQLFEGLELISRMHVLAADVFIEADLVPIVGGVDDAADRFGLFDLVALHPQKLRQPSAFADGDEIEPGCRAVRIKLRFDDKILQDAFGGDAGRIGFNRRFAVRRLARVLWGLLELVERNETLGPALRDGFDFLGRHDRSPFRAWGASAPAPAPLPVGETGGSKCLGDPSGGGSPALKGRSKSGSAQANDWPPRFRI